LEIKSINL